MKRFSTIILMLVCAISVVAQQKTSDKTKWRTYISPKDNFSVEIPDRIKELFFSIKDGENKETHSGGQYLGFHNGNYYYISTVKIPKQVKERVKPSLPPTLRKFVDENANNSDLIEIGNYSGTEWVFKDKEDFTHKIIAIQTPNYAYVFHTVVEDPTNADITRFFNSIKFYNSLNTKRIKTALRKSSSMNKEPKIKETIANDKNYVPVTREIRQEPSQEITTQQSSPTPSTTNLQVKSKPRANYTDLARIYQLQGTVTLRVTFLANGKIGAVTPISKLPLGLTDSAIYAAKQITFSPSTKEGFPINVVKQVQYNFTLF